jgi:hypothetical protein
MQYIIIINIEAKFVQNIHDEQNIKDLNKGSSNITDFSFGPRLGVILCNDVDLRIFPSTGMW